MLVNTACGGDLGLRASRRGVGIGYAIHAGQVIVADGTREAAMRLERVLTADPATGVIRHVDAGYEKAVRTRGSEASSSPARSDGGQCPPYDLLRSTIQTYNTPSRYDRAAHHHSRRRRGQKQRQDRQAPAGGGGHWRTLGRRNVEHVILQFAADRGVAANDVREPRVLQRHQQRAGELVLVPETVAVADARELVDQHGFMSDPTSAGNLVLRQAPTQMSILFTSPYASCKRPLITGLLLT